MEVAAFLNNICGVTAVLVLPLSLVCALTIDFGVAVSGVVRTGSCFCGACGQFNGAPLRPFPDALLLLDPADVGCILSTLGVSGVGWARLCDWLASAAKPTKLKGILYDIPCSFLEKSPPPALRYVPQEVNNALKVAEGQLIG